ncbi:variant erythrocyte surface antigen-1 family protein [Babesia caballi]|uniref:Variant erythrocyte surface antigen-1 family protein n=1 Tax=Babesia caballi TaxID=5871 RepID=A0AAV4LQR5_BABCB|nr:variant erythrocyte surface antigen-1 family protein [Babesia caballi]
MLTPLTDWPNNLKDVIDWFLRVGGKDQESKGNDKKDELQNAVEALKGFSKGVDGIGTINVAGLFNKVANGLQSFIGYDPSGGTVKTDSIDVGKITGGGILPANVARHQVWHAVLNFVIRFLEKLWGIEKLESPNKDGVVKVISTLRQCVGTGQVPGGFGKLVEGIKGKVETDSGFSSQVGTKLKEVFGKLKDIVTTANLEKGGGNNVEDLNQFLGQAFNGRGNNETSNDFQKLCQNIANLFGDGNVKTSLSTDKKLEVNGLNAIDQVTTFTKKLIPSNFKTDLTKALAAGVKSAATSFIAEVKEPGKYTSYYDRSENTEVNNVQCAKIFLGCLPLYYQALTYIYWGCHDKGGPWRNLTLGGGALRSYFDSQGLLPTFVDTNKRGAHIAESALNKFTELQQGMTKATSSSSFPYASFAAELRKKVGQNSGQLADSCPLSALFYGASCYFRCQQFKNAKLAGGTPKTIREMLYFLAALQFSPQYGAFDGYVTSHFRTLLGTDSYAKYDSELKLQVADSGTSATGDTLSVADVKSYLTSTFHLAPAFIGLIQEPSKSGEPWLHSLFSNSQFNLSIPSSGAGILGALSNYAYALQFQLHFLYQQCNNTYTKACGWNQCTFGQKINQSSKDKVVPSHICVIGCTKNSGSHDHNSEPDECEHNGCGTKNKPSPLQAFLTDKLSGFIRGHPSDPSSHLAFCSGSLCHVPMGFRTENLRPNPALQGENICLTLRPICGDVSSPFRQLSEKLGCLTKRTPRTLGDLFGFTWHLNGQLFASQNQVTVNESLMKFFQSLGVSRSNWGTISTLAPSAFWSAVEKRIASLNPPSQTQPGIAKALAAFSGLPFLYQLFMVSPGESLPAVLFKVKNIPHQTKTDPNYNGQHNDLYSLYDPNFTTPPNQSCGPYLYPLTHTDGATYVPVLASAYLSWLLYLSDDFEAGLRYMLDHLDTHQCTNCNNTSCSPGRHVKHTASQCLCSSVVDCADILPLFYNNGFTFHNAYQLKHGDTSQRNEGRRTCAHFHSQLQSVISGNPLSNLLTSIDDFLYAIRWVFFTKLSAFWTIYICLILYTFFFLLDTLHVRSHLKLTASQIVPPLALLTTGKAPALKKFTKLAYFIP